MLCVLILPGEGLFHLGPVSPSEYIHLVKSGPRSLRRFGFVTLWISVFADTSALVCGTGQLHPPSNAQTDTLLHVAHSFLAQSRSSVRSVGTSRRVGGTGSLTSDEVDLSLMLIVDPH